MISSSISEKFIHVIPVIMLNNSPSSSSTAKPSAGSSVLIASLSPPQKFTVLASSSINFPRNLHGFFKLHRFNFRRVSKLQSNTPFDQFELSKKQVSVKNIDDIRSLKGVAVASSAIISWLSSSQVAYSSTDFKLNPVYEVGELFELGIQLSYVLLLLALLGAGTFFVIRQVLVRRELDLSAKELQEQVRSGDANATELFELGAVMLRRKFYPAATKYLLQAIDKWDGDDQDLAQVYNALGVSYVRDGKLEKGIAQFENAVKLQPGYVTAWNNLGDAYEQKNELKLALKAFEEVLLFDPNNRVARPRVDSLRDRVNMYKGVPVKSNSKERS